MMIHNPFYATCTFDTPDLICNCCTGNVVFISQRNRIRKTAYLRSQLIHPRGRKKKS